MSAESQVRVDPVPLSWRIKERPGHTLVEFHGEIDEHADFGELRRRLRGALVFDLGEVRRINSCGVREWVNFVRDLAPAPGNTSGVTDLVFTHCSPGWRRSVTVVMPSSVSRAASAALARA